MKLILGSQSAGRQRVLASWGYAFAVMAADLDEKTIRADDPDELTLALARAKASALLPRIHDPALLITADQVVVCHGRIREKPAEAGQARACLRDYAFHPAETVTAVVVTHTAHGIQRTGVDRARVWFRPIPDAVIEQVIADGTVFSHAGAFSIEDPLLAAYIQRIDGERESVIGLPKRLTLRLLREMMEEGPGMV